MSSIHNPRPPLPKGQRRCRRCKNRKPLDEFPETGDLCKRCAEPDEDHKTTRELEDAAVAKATADFMAFSAQVRQEQRDR